MTYTPPGPDTNGHHHYEAPPAAPLSYPLAPPARRRRRWPWIAGLIALAVLCGIGAAFQENPPSNPPAGERPATAAQADTTATPAAPASPAAPAGPLDTITDGTWLVHHDGMTPDQAATAIRPGTYATTVPTDEFICYWERLADTSGGFEAIIANQALDPGANAVVSIDAGDAAFHTEGCGTWTLTA